MQIFKISQVIKSFILTPKEYIEKKPSIALITSIALKIIGAIASLYCPIFYLSDLASSYYLYLSASVSLLSFGSSFYIDYTLIQNILFKAKNEINTLKDNFNKKISVLDKGMMPIVNYMINQDPIDNGYQMGNLVGIYIKTMPYRTLGFIKGIYKGVFK